MAKRQKIVYSDFFDVAHNWAHQTQEESRCRSLLHGGKSLYSYGRHYEIARHIEALDGSPMMLFNRDSNSRITEDHKRTTMQAIPNETVMFFVPTDGFFNTRKEGTRRTVGEEMYKVFVRTFVATFREIIELADKQKRARTTDYRHQIIGKIANLRVAYKAFELYRAHRSRGWEKKLIHVPPILEYLKTDKPKRNYYNEERGYVGSERISVGRNKQTTWIVPLLEATEMFTMLPDNSDYLHDMISLEQVDNFLEQLYAGQGEAVEDYQKYTERLAKAAGRQREKERKARLERAQESIVKWRLGAQITLYDVEDTLLRVVTAYDTNMENPTEYIETSKRITLTVEEGQRLWDFWKAVKKREKDFTNELAVDANGQKWHIQSIDRYGTMKAGCHVIKFSEAVEVAKKLNFNMD